MHLYFKACTYCVVKEDTKPTNLMRQIAATTTKRSGMIVRAPLTLSSTLSTEPGPRRPETRHGTNPNNVYHIIIIDIRRSGWTMEYILRLLGWSSVACGYKVQCGSGSLYRKGHNCAWSLVYLRCCVPFGVPEQRETKTHN